MIVSGKWSDSTKELPFYGTSTGITVKKNPAGIHPGPAALAANGKNEVRITWYDLRGRVIQRQTFGATPTLASLREVTLRWKAGHAASVYLVRVEIRDKISGKIEGRVMKQAVY